MFNLGPKEILIVSVIILFLFGSQKLTEWAKGLGDAGRELKKAKKEFDTALDETDEEIEDPYKISELNRSETKDPEPFKSKRAKIDSKG